jgi:2-polyprenyl-3-methyl-5-hydroxy-6-metoxy-1,4-benzoquinol methylase
MSSPARTPCWCGETGGPAIGHDYRRCARCGTAVVSVLPAGLGADPRQDDGLYGKSYWLDHQKARGLPDVRERARTDLSERCLFWLERLLETVRPPGRALEIGCGHGAFVSILRELGFDAIGMDLSPWIVEFARATFGATVRQGTLETVELEPGFTCIAAFDVLEHLADPLETVRRCARLLAPDGVLLLQTPCYRGESADWAMFQPGEHIYLFSEVSVRELLRRAGFNDVRIRPSLFAYDMWIAATPGKLAHHPLEGDAGPEGWRLPATVRALLDVHAQAEALRRALLEAETDRAERLRQTEQLTAMARKAEADRLTQTAALTRQIEELIVIARKAEADRLEQVETLTRLLRESEDDRAARLEVIHGAQAQIHALQARLEQIERTTVWRVYRRLARKP